MGVIASLVLERRTSKRWQNVGDLLFPVGDEYRGKGKNMKSVKVPQVEICYHTVPHNRLVAAHLLGAFNTMSVGDAPDDFPHELRIAGHARGVPKDIAASTKAAVAKRKFKPSDQQPSYCTLKEILAFDWTQPISHKFWMNGPMMLKWYRKEYQQMPDHVETYYHTTDKPQDKDAIIVEIEELQALVKKCFGGVSDPKEQERKITAWADSRWAYVEREYPLLTLCEDFLGTVVSQLLNGGDPKDARVICWVS